jgi:hypothetical protein
VNTASRQIQGASQPVLLAVLLWVRFNLTLA